MLLETAVVKRRPAIEGSETFSMRCQVDCSENRDDVLLHTKTIVGIWGCHAYMFVVGMFGNPYDILLLSILVIRLIRYLILYLPFLFPNKCMMSVEGEDNLPSPVSVPPEPVAGHPFVATETKLTPTPTPTPIPISASDANPGHLGGQYAYAAELEAAPVPTSAPVTDPGHLGGQSADATEADPTPVLIPAPAPNLGPVGGQLGGAIEADVRILPNLNFNLED